MLFNIDEENQQQQLVESCLLLNENRNYLFNQNLKDIEVAIGRALSVLDKKMKNKGFVPVKTTQAVQEIGIKNHFKKLGKNELKVVKGHAVNLALDLKGKVAGVQAYYVNKETKKGKTVAVSYRKYIV
jgi:hypothetical protein